MRRILCAALTVAILSSCAGPAAQENASREDDTGEEETAFERGGEEELVREEADSQGERGERGRR